MERLADSIEFAERQVVARKQVALAELHAVETKVRKAVTSPKVIVGVLVGAMGLAYLLASRRLKDKPAPAKSGSAWRQFVPLLQVVLPMMGAAMGKKVDTPPRKKVVVANNAPDTR